MKKLIGITIIIFAYSISAAQTINPQYNYHISDTIHPTYGSATSLKGATLIVNYFVSTGKKDWKQQEKKEMLRKQQDGLQWLQKQATAFGFETTFNISSIGYDSDVKLEELYGGETNKRHKFRMIPYVLNTLGIKNLYFYYDSIHNLNQYDHVIVQIFANKDGRSFAYKSNTNYRNYNNFLEGSVIYKQWNNVDVSAATIAHELLHCFGAVDIYKIQQQDDELLRKVGYIFTNSIMLNTHREISSIKIDQLTAWCIGWSKKYYGWYNYFTNKNAVIWHAPLKK